MLAGGAFSLSLGLIREVCPLDLSMETTTRNTIILTNKGLAFMTHADNQSGVLSKSSRESTSFLTAADYITDIDQYRVCYHHDGDYHRNRRLAAVDVIPYDADDLLRVVHML